MVDEVMAPSAVPSITAGYTDDDGTPSSELSYDSRYDGAAAEGSAAATI